MTASQIEALEALAKKATPGPWDCCSNSWEISSVYANGDLVAEVPIDGDVTEETQDEHERRKDANAELITALVNAWPALRDLALEALRGRQEGMVMVPRTPTPDMIDAGGQAMFEDVRRKDCADIVKRGYKAMLAAAPDNGEG